MAVGVGARHAVEGQRCKGRVSHIAVQPHHDALHRFKVLGSQHVSCHLHGVELRACAKVVCKVAQRVILGAVGNGVAKVDGISSARLERVHQLHADASARSFDFRHIDLRWRHNHLLACVINLHRFVKGNRHLSGPLSRVAQRRQHLHNAWRCFVVRSPIGPRPRIGARKQHTRHTKQRAYQGRQVSGMKVCGAHQLSFNMSSIMSRLLLSRGTLCCPPSLPLLLSQSLNKPWRAVTTSSRCSVMSLWRFAS